MTWKETKALIAKDLSRLTPLPVGGGKVLRYLITNHSFKITFWFRVASYLHEKKGLLWKILYSFVYVVYKHYMYKTGIQLLVGAKIGGGLTFAHFSCIIIHYAAQIGENCTIYQGVTIGGTREPGSTVIGDNVVIFSGVKIIRNVTIGDNVVIGANAVVTKDIPSESVVVGVPAKVVNNDARRILKRFINEDFDS